MNIPRKIKVGGLDYKINLTDNITLGKEYTGEVLYKDCTINIRDCAMKEQTFLHELFHVMFWALGYTEHNETVIDGLASQLLAIIKDNKNIFI